MIGSNELEAAFTDHPADCTLPSETGPQAQHTQG